MPFFWHFFFQFRNIVPGYGYLPLPPAGATDRALPPAAYADFGANSVVSAAQLALPAPHSVTPRNDSGTSALTLATASHLQRDTLARAAGPTLGGCLCFHQFIVIIIIFILSFDVSLLSFLVES